MANELTYDRLKEMGAFVSPTPFPVDVELPNGTYTAYIRELGGCEKIDLFYANASADRSVAARLLSAAVCLDATGKKHLSFADACRLTQPVMETLVAAVTKINQERSVNPTS